MNSDKERSLFEAYGWEYDHVGRRWVNHNQTVAITLDFLVGLTSEPGGEILLMRAIVQCGRKAPE